VTFTEASVLILLATETIGERFCCCQEKSGTKKAAPGSDIAAGRIWAVSAAGILFSTAYAPSARVSLGKTFTKMRIHPQFLPRTIVGRSAPPFWNVALRFGLIYKQTGRANSFVGS
jgi:hypothetical protein